MRGIGICAPTHDSVAQIKEELNEKLTETIQGTPKKKKVKIFGYLKVRVGRN